MTDRPDTLLNRRDVLRLGAVGAGALAAHALGTPPAGGLTGLASMIEVRDRPLDVVRIGFVGVGLQGTSHVENFLKIDGVEVRAVCDVVEDRAARAQQMVVDAGFARPGRLRAGDPHDFERLCERDDLDLVVHGDAMGVARAGLRRGDEGRQARRHRGSRRRDHRGLLAAGGDVGVDPAALRDAGELQLRPVRDDGPQHGAAGRAGRARCTPSAATATTSAPSSTTSRARGFGGGLTR